MRIAHSTIVWIDRTHDAIKMMVRGVAHTAAVLGALVLAGGCDQDTGRPGPHRWGEVGVYFSRHQPHAGTADERAELLDDASDILGVLLYETDNPWGALSVYLVDQPTPDGYVGTADWLEGCVRFGWSVAHEVALGHEIGHLLGLPHAEHDPSNIMHPRLNRDREYHLAEWQMAVIEQQAAVLLGCRQ